MRPMNDVLLPFHEPTSTKDAVVEGAGEARIPATFVLGEEAFDAAHVLLAYRAKFRS